ncbi:MAG: hypothetical protein IJ499_07155 [Clostridia bacterium]|nr:hypothetical protein [Clostridia bacterium]
MKRIVLAVLLSLVMIVLASCVEESKNSEDETTAPDTTQETAEKTDETVGFFKTDEETYDIETSLVTLKFPVRWQNDVVVSVEDGEGGVCADFTAQLDSRSIPLYTITIGSTGEGYLLGTITTESGEKNVYLIDRYDKSADQLPDVERTKYYEMCEDVNVIISKLVYDSGMVLAD